MSRSADAAMLNAENAATSVAMVALDLTGKRVWNSPPYDVTTADLHATASDLVFTGGNEGYYALDGKSGTPLWKASLGSPS